MNCDRFCHISCKIYMHKQPFISTLEHWTFFCKMVDVSWLWSTICAVFLNFPYIFKSNCACVVLTLPWPCIDLSLTLLWPCLDPALTLPLPCFYLALMLPWTYLDLPFTLTLLLLCPGFALTLPWWPFLDLALTFFGARANFDVIFIFKIIFPFFCHLHFCPALT